MAIPDPATTDWVPIWNPLTQGPVGPAGPQGPQGIPGNAVPHHLTHESGGIDEVLFPVGIKERGRSVAMGEWIDFTPVLGPTGVTLSSSLSCRYMLVGKTLVVGFYLNINTIATPVLTLNLPAGFTAATYSGSVGIDSTTAILLHTGPGDVTLNLYRNTSGATNWPIVNTYIAGTAVIPI